tara:strand:- start:12712 stop:13671 length:960 start_codon:yes stop_codon:yes gene_type:complete
MKILITGVAGFIGFSIAKKLLLNKKNLVFGIDNFDNYYSVKYKKKRISTIIKNKNFYFNKIDIRDKKKINDFFKKNYFDVIMHFAAQAGVRYSLKNPKKYIQVNKIGFNNILDLIKKKPPQKIIYASSSSVYGDVKKFPTKENCKLNPNNIYARTKISNEKLAKIYKKKYKLNICGLRFFTVYGEWGRPDMFLFKLLKSYKNKKYFYLNNFGNHSRDFTYSSDVVKILSKLLKLKKFNFEIANVCNSKPVNIRDICNKFEKDYNFKSIKLVKKNKADVLNTHGDNSKIKKILRIKKFTSFDKGFKKTTNWYFRNSINKF